MFVCVTACSIIVTLVCVYVYFGSPNTTYICFSGSLVISVYAVCPDITATVTPDLDDPEGKGQSQTLKRPD